MSENAIEFKNVTFAYPNGYVANENLNFSIKAGERVAIIGQNGAGKTTAAKMMNGLYKPTSGDVFVDGINTKDRTTAQIARTVGYVFQNPDEQIFNNTVISEIEYMPRYFKIESEEIKKRTTKSLSLTELEEYQNMNPFDISYSIRKFVTIAAVLETEPRYTIWDEPTAGQDYKRRKILIKILDYLRDNGIAVVVITHDMDFVVEVFDRIIVMANKHVIADGNAKEIFWQDNIVKQSCITQPQIGEIAKALDLKKPIIFRKDMVDYLKNYKEGNL